jgi:polyphosphate kinase
VALACLALAAGRGVRVRRWEELSVETRRLLVRHFEDELLPLLTPRAVTLSPGHPFPVIPHLTLAFAVLLWRSPAGSTASSPSPEPRAS